MKQNRLIVFLAVMSVLVLAMFNFTMYSQQQIFSLEQYRLAQVDFENGDYSQTNNLISFDNSLVNYSTSLNADFENGLIIDNDNVYHVVNGEPKLIKIEGDLSLENIYSQYLIYYYTFYMSPVMLLAYVGLAIGKSIVGIALIYTVYRIILHKAKRDQVYIKSSKFTEYKLSIVSGLLLANIIFAYSSYFIGYKLPIITYAVFVVGSYILVLKSFKKFKR